MRVRGQPKLVAQPCPPFSTPVLLLGCSPAWVHVRSCVPASLIGGESGLREGAPDAANNLAEGGRGRAVEALGPESPSRGVDTI